MKETRKREERICDDYENEIKIIKLESESINSFKEFLRRIKESLRKEKKSLKEYCNEINV